MSRRETERILQAVREAAAASQRVALATVVRIRGSAYRREGARIVVREDGTHECLLSGGCLEPTVALAAARVIATGESAVVSYDLADDSVFGLGIGCSGAVDVRIERVGDDPILQAWFDLLAQTEAGVLVTPLAGAVGRLLVRADGNMLGGLSDPALQSRVVSEALDRARAPDARSGAERVALAEMFYEVSLASSRLVVFGAGDDTVPLTKLAWQLGFVVTVVDVREALVTSARFPEATTRVLAHFTQFADLVPLDAQSFVVVLNHHLERDRESLRFALASKARYIGVLGPRARYRRLMAGLDWPADAVHARVRSPIGLALGAETPEEIAVSVMGEILAIRRGFDGGFLDGREDSLHRPSEIRAAARS
jgi:xanthine dehydrogenase accessory factor